MKYKIGDRVKVREDLIVDQGYPHVYFKDHMKPYKVVTIKGYTIYGYSVKENVFVYSDNMLEGLYEENKMKFKVGDIVIGNELANIYFVTREGYIGEVVTINHRTMFIRRPKNASASVYKVGVDCFDLYKKIKRKIIK